MIPFLRKYFGKLIYPLLWSLVTGVLLSLPGSLLPDESRFTFPQFDKVVHITLFGGFVFIWNLYLSNRISRLAPLLRWFFLIFILANAYGISMEYVQRCCIPLRDFDEADIIADMIGGGVAYGLSHLLLLPGEKHVAHR
jgi:hypothetical protein